MEVRCGCDLPQSTGGSSPSVGECRGLEAQGVRVGVYSSWNSAPMVALAAGLRRPAWAALAFLAALGLRTVVCLLFRSLRPKLCHGLSERLPSTSCVAPVIGADWLFDSYLDQGVLPQRRLLNS